jgi:hypothetical protein
VWNAEEARERYGVAKALGAVTYPAATHSTYKLVTGLWQKLLQQYPDNLSIETHTPALDVR